VGIASLSDSIIPYVAEYLLGMPNRGIHLGFIEKWWLVNPMAMIGIFIAWLWPRTKFPHAGACIIKHMGFSISHYNGQGRRVFKTVFIFYNSIVFISCGMHTLLRE